ncbi:MAG: TonB family protein, partial [Bacteroidales bacterium]|nr:TonB family protein [Bacteroidales bacterium]
KRFLFTIALSAICITGLFSQSESIIRMKRDVAILTADSLMGRASGSPWEIKAARYITKEFADADIPLLYPFPGQDFSIVIKEGDTLFSQNIVAIVEGWDPSLKNEYIVVGAHYDHLGFNNLNINGKDSLQIFRGADDNASGTAVMLEVARLARAQSFNFRRSVIFAAFGSEERGMIGSWYFANRAFAHIDKVSLMVNLDMVGRGADRNSLSAYTVMPNTELVTTLKDVSDMPAMITPVIHTKDYFPSDHQVFATMGIPVVLLTTELHRDYHTPRDTPEKLNYTVMEDIAQYTLNLIKSVANYERMLGRTVLAKAKQEDEVNDRIYSQNEVEKRATFTKGDEREFLRKWVHHYLRYPAAAINEGIQGRVIVDFIVEKNGEVSNVSISKSVDELLDAEALRVISASPKWKAAQVAGAPVRVKISIPVEFKLKR